MIRLALLASILATPVMADPENYGHMMDWGHGYGFGMLFGPVLWLIVLGLVVAAVIWFVRSLVGPLSHQKPSSAIAELDLRFARGEIDAEEYAARKKLLSS